MVAIGKTRKQRRVEQQRNGTQIDTIPSGPFAASGREEQGNLLKHRGVFKQGIEILDKAIGGKVNKPGYIGAKQLGRAQAIKHQLEQGRDRAKEFYTDIVPAVSGYDRDIMQYYCKSLDVRSGHLVDQFKAKSDTAQRVTTDSAKTAMMFQEVNETNDEASALTRQLQQNIIAAQAV